MSDPIRNILQEQFDGATRELNKALIRAEKAEKENEELRELLREGCQLLKDEQNFKAHKQDCVSAVYFRHDCDCGYSNSIEFLNRPEVKALLERGKE